MGNEGKLIFDDKMEKVAGGIVNPPWSQGMKPKHDGETCPDCGYCKLRFVQFQDYNGAREEVEYCLNCDYVKFKV